MSSLAFPQLWLPRRELIAPRPTFRQRLARLMATAGMGQVNATTGRARLNANGRWITNASSSSGCCCVGCDCSQNGCNSSTSPLSFTLVASGIDYTSAVGTCFNNGTASAKVNANPANPNGTFTLQQQSIWEVAFGCCVWMSSNGTPPCPTGGTMDVWSSNTTCSGTPDFTQTLAMSWILVKYSGKWTLGFTECNAPFFPDDRNAQIFDAAITTIDPIDCKPATQTFSNTFSAFGWKTGLLTTWNAGAGVNAWGIGKDGSATVTFP